MGFFDFLRPGCFTIGYFVFVVIVLSIVSGIIGRESKLASAINIVSTGMCLLFMYGWFKFGRAVPSSCGY